MTFRSLIDKAGRFPVAHAVVPHFRAPVNLNAPRAGVLHTTEGGWAGSLSVFKVHFAPHFMVGLNANDKKVEVVQFVPVGTIGAATKAHNDMAIVQVEMIGFSKDKPWLPDEQTLEALASLMNVCKDEWGIPLSHPWPDGDFGRAGNNPHRHAGKFGKVAGWFGHGDMPSPDTHWDPGALKWSEVFAKCHELASTPVA